MKTPWPYLAGMAMLLAAPLSLRAVPVPVPGEPFSVSPQGKSLRGIKNIIVLTTGAGEALTRAGVDAKQLSRDLEQKTRKAGLRAITVEGLARKSVADLKAGKTPEEEAFDGILAVQVATLATGGKPPVAFSVTMRFMQQVTLARDPSSGAHASTWEETTLHPAPAKDLARSIRAAVGRAGDRFVKDYRAENTGAQ